MRVHSEPGRGTIFLVYLPAIDACTVRTCHGQHALVPGGSETLLVAEDEEHVLGLLTELLQSQGYTVLPARDGEEALAVFEANQDRIDGVVLDVVMPKLGGRDVANRIRELAPATRILFSTGYTANAIDREFLASTGMRVVEKPYAPYKLFKAVRDVLEAPAR